MSDAETNDRSGKGVFARDAHISATNSRARMGNSGTTNLFRGFGKSNGLSSLKEVDDVFSHQSPDHHSFP